MGGKKEMAREDGTWRLMGEWPRGFMWFASVARLRGRVRGRASMQDCAANAKTLFVHTLPLADTLGFAKDQTTIVTDFQAITDSN